MVFYILDKCSAQTLSRSLKRDEIQVPSKIRRANDTLNNDPKENYNESKLMNALFARYNCGFTLFVFIFDNVICTYCYSLIRI